MIAVRKAEEPPQREFRLSRMKFNERANSRRLNSNGISEPMKRLYRGCEKSREKTKGMKYFSIYFNEYVTPCNALRPRNYIARSGWPNFISSTSNLRANEQDRDIKWLARPKCVLCVFYLSFPTVRWERSTHEGWRNAARLCQSQPSHSKSFQLNYANLQIYNRIILRIFERNANNFYDQLTPIFLDKNCEILSNVNIRYIE